MSLLCFLLIAADSLGRVNTFLATPGIDALGIQKGNEKIANMHANDSSSWSW